MGERKRKRTLTVIAARRLRAFVSRGCPDPEQLHPLESAGPRFCPPRFAFILPVSSTFERPQMQRTPGGQNGLSRPSSGCAINTLLLPCRLLLSSRQILRKSEKAEHPPTNEKQKSLKKRETPKEICVSIKGTGAISALAVLSAVSGFCLLCCTSTRIVPLTAAAVSGVYMYIYI